MLLRQTADQANDRRMGGLKHLPLGDFLRSARDNRPLKFLVQVPRLQESLNDAENEQHPLFLLSDEHFVSLSPAAALAIYIGRKPQQLIEQGITQRCRDRLNEIGRA